MLKEFNMKEKQHPKQTRTSEKKKTKKLNTKNLIIKISVLLLIIAFVYYIVKKPGSSDKRQPDVPFMDQTEFHKDGELAFIHRNTSDTIKTIDIEIANTKRARTLGLMYRKQMVDTLGMLFIFDQSEPRSFWMKNTYIPLDIIYVDNGTIVTISEFTQPLSEKSVPSVFPAKYVIEVNAGFCQQNKITEGDSIHFVQF